MKEFFKRLTLETPVFFKRLRAIGLSLSAVGTSLVAIPNIPANLSSIAATAIWVGAAIAAVAQLTAQNPEEIKKDSTPA